MNEILGIGIIALIVIVIALAVVWLWMSWVCVEIIIAHFGIPGGLLMQIFLWLLVSGIIGGAVHK